MRKFARLGLALLLISGCSAPAVTTAPTPTQPGFTTQATAKAQLRVGNWYFWAWGETDGADSAHVKLRGPGHILWAQAEE